MSNSIDLSKFGVTEEFLTANNYVFWLEVNGDLHAVIPAIFNGRLCINVSPMYYEDFYCYKDTATAIASLIEWAETVKTNPNAEPEGWHRHGSTGRRRPGGDKTKEEVYA